jgi:hypothetical protein
MVEVLQGLFWSVQLILKSTQFCLLQTQLLFRLGYLRLGFSFVARRCLVPSLDLGQRIIESLLFCRSSLMAAFLIFDLLDAVRALSLVEPNLSEPCQSNINPICTLPTIASSAVTR